MTTKSIQCDMLKKALHSFCVPGKKLAVMTERKLAQGGYRPAYLITLFSDDEYFRYCLNRSISASIRKSKGE